MIVQPVDQARAEGLITRDTFHTVVARGLAGAGESLCADPDGWVTFVNNGEDEWRGDSQN